MEVNENYITLVDDEGNESLYEILLTFDSEDYEKSYVFIYPAGSGEDEEVEIQAYAYLPSDQEDDAGTLQAIEDVDEWDMVEEVLSAFLMEEDI